MLVLALDTTTRAGSCALAHDGVVLREEASDPQQSHAEHLPGDLIALLDREGIALTAIDVFAVATGPGSFTGLRVGIATMQGLAFAMGKPLIGVSALDALADAVSRPAPPREPTAGVLTATWIDAWRGEVYAALYEDGREIEPPTVEHPEQILARLQATHPSGAVRFVGDGAGTFSGLIRDRLGDRAVVTVPAAPLLAGAIAQLATAAAAAGDCPSPDAIRPLYVRRTDAELARDARVVR